LGSVLSYWSVLVVVATLDLHPFLAASLPYPPRVTGWTSTLLEVYAVLSMLLASWDCLPKLRHLPGLNFLLCISFPLACELEEACSHFALTRNVCCACRVVPSRSSSSCARGGYLVGCDSSRHMSLCNGLPARARGLTALLCMLCVFSRLLLIIDDEPAWSLLAAAWAAADGRVACSRAMRAGSVVSCRVLLTAGRPGGRPRRPCRAFSMGRRHQVMTVCETATWAHRSSVAHLVSLHRSYSHRTAREGVRSPSGSAAC
jgi:hypothetical protein